MFSLRDYLLSNLICLNVTHLHLLFRYLKNDHNYSLIYCLQKDQPCTQEMLEQHGETLEFRIRLMLYLHL